LLFEQEDSGGLLQDYTVVLAAELQVAFATSEQQQLTD
jgi:hypothetical protein